MFWHGGIRRVAGQVMGKNTDFIWVLNPVQMGDLSELYTKWQNRSACYSYLECETFHPRSPSAGPINVASCLLG